MNPLSSCFIIIATCSMSSSGLAVEMVFAIASRTFTPDTSSWERILLTAPRQSKHQGQGPAYCTLREDGPLQVATPSPARSEEDRAQRWQCQVERAPAPMPRQVLRLHPAL